jgi:glutathione S-transferase
MLEHKGIPYERKDLFPGAHPAQLRLAGFGGITVPALEVDGRRIQGTTEICRYLEESQPEPSLYPEDPELRRAVEAAERWGETVFQPIPRRIFRWVLRHDGDLRVLLAKAMGMPAPKLAAAANLPVVSLLGLASGSTAEAVRGDLLLLPSILDHVDYLIEDGTIGAERRTAADFQILTTVQALSTFVPLRPLIEGRPAWDHAQRIDPQWKDRPFPAAIPAEWIPSAVPAG